MSITGRGEFDEREWQAQERALREARNGFGAPVDDLLVAQYRHVAQALRQPPPGGLPVDFAAQVAGVAGLRGSTAATFEQWLVRSLSIAFALSGLVVLAVYGERLLALLQTLVSAESLQWALLSAACVGLSWSLDWIRRQLRHHDGPAQAA